MDEKAKLDFDAASIVGLVFSLMGLIYLCCGIGLWVHPADAEAVSVAKVFLPLGAALLAVGGSLLVRLLVKKKAANRLLEEGRYVWGQVTELRENKHINGFRGHPCVAYITHRNSSGETQTFRSRHIYRKNIGFLIGKQVRIYKTNEAHTSYYVDIDALLSSFTDQ